MTVQQGHPIPDATLRTLRDGKLVSVSTKELTASKTVVIFGVPGAFTPTCSEQHLPGFIRHADAIKAKGVSEIVCVSVNDPFVMDAWGRDVNAESIVMMGDGNGEFTEAMGLWMDGSSFGLGKRSQRYAMIVKDGIVDRLEVEQPQEFKVSKAEYILQLL